MKKYCCFLFLFIISFTIWNLQVVAQEVSVSDPMVVDVTTRSFSVVWMADKASTPQLEVFSDSDGLDSISVSIINVSQGYPPAEDQGVLKVAVTDLTAGTIYYYRMTTTAKDGSGSSVYPVATPLPSVTTESVVKRTIMSGEGEIPFSNDLLTIDVFQEDGVTPADGALIVLDITGSDYPVSAFVGKGSVSPATILDLNNVFDKDTHESLDLKGNEGATLRLMGGVLGNTYVSMILPVDSGKGEVVSYGASSETLKTDSDGDGIPDGTGINTCMGGNTDDCDDNCKDLTNPAQEDTDNDGVGDVCEIITVPDVTGSAQAEAEAAIVAAGLTVGTVSTANNDTVPAGNVISQSPAAGVEVSGGNVVDLMVSLGPLPVQVSVPDVTGMSQADAEAAIIAAGLVVGSLSPELSGSDQYGEVIGQNPVAEDVVSEGSAVDLTFSIITVESPWLPCVVGMDLAVAQSAILGQDLVIGTVTEQHSDTVPVGKIISQVPSVCDVYVAQGTTVNLVVSLGPDNGLVAYYPFSGNANDESGNGNDGTVNGATLTTDRFGNPHSAYSFNGVNDYVEIPSNLKNMGVSDSFTITIWVKSPASGGMQMLLEDGTQFNTDAFYLGVRPDINRIFARLNTSASSVWNDNIPVPPFADEWIHLAFTYDGNQIFVYFNGNPVYQPVITGTIKNGNRNLRIGFPSGEHFFNGIIDELRFYNRSLTETEIQQLYEGGSSTAGISVTPKSNDFENVNVGNSSSAQTFTISNNGTENLAIDTINIEGIDPLEYSVQNDTCTGQALTPSATCTLDVVFSPTSEGLKTANLSILSSDSDTPVLNVTLSGNGKIPVITPKDCNEILINGKSVGDAVYIIDPDGPGGQDPISVDCLMSLSGGGWTKLTDVVSITILNTDENAVREYLFVKNDKWYRTPSSNLVWDWNSGKVLKGDYYYSGEESFYCGSSGEVPLYGVNCSNGPGHQWKALIYYNTGKDPANGRVQLCQDLPGIFGGTCQTGVDVYVRNTHNSNNPPVITPIPDQDMYENGSLSIPVSAMDLDGDSITLSVNGLPGFGTFTDNGDGTGLIEFNPGFGDADDYLINIVASDGITVTEPFTLIVNNINRAPILAEVGNQTLNEGDSLTVEISASDPDNDDLSFSVFGLPPFASLTDNGDGTGSIELTPGSGDRDSYEVTVTVTDSRVPNLSDSEEFTIVVDSIVIDVNPVSIDFGDVSVGSTAYNTLTIANAGTSALGVADIQSSNGLFSVFPPVNFSIEPGGPVRLVSIGFTPIGEDDFSGAISIMSNAGDPVVINVTGRGVLDSDPGDIDTSDSLEFGNVEEGDFVEQILTIRNVGDGPLTVSDFSTDNTVFEVSAIPGVSLPFTINPDESHNLTVRFAPQSGSAGTSYTGVLSIVSDDPDEGTGNVALSGNSINEVDPLVNSYVLGARIYFGPDDFDLINSSNCSDVGVQMQFSPETSSADSFKIVITDQGGGFVESASLVPGDGGGTTVFNGIDACGLDDGIIKVEIIYTKDGTELTPFSGNLAVKYTGILEPPVLDHVLPVTFSQTIEVCGTSRANTTVRIEGGASVVSVTLDENTTEFCLTVPLRPNTQNTLIASAIDDLAPAPKPVAFSKPVQVVQVDFSEILIVSASSRPLTQEETEYLVDNGIIDLTDPSNFNVSMFTVVFTIGSFPVPITVTQPVVVNPTPGAVSYGSSGGGWFLDEPDEISFSECISGCAQIVTITGEGGQTIPGVIIIDGRIKTLKEFFQVTLAIWNISGGFNLSDMSSTINLPAGLTPIATGIGSEIPDVNLEGTVDTVLIGEIAPGETGVGQFIIRGDGIGTHNINVDFEGFVTGGGLPEPIPVSGSAGTSVQVLGPPELDVHLRFLVNPDGPDVTFGDIFDFIVDITNTSDRPALYASLELFTGGDVLMVDEYGNPISESNEIRSFGHIQPGETVTAAFRLKSLSEGEIIACQAIAAENITLTIDIGPDGVPCNIVNSYPANFVPLPPESAPVVIGVNPANGQTDIPITTSVFAVMTPRSACIVADTWTNVVTDLIDPNDPGKGLQVISADLVSAGTFYLEELDSYGTPVRHIPVDLTVVDPPAGGTTIAVLRLGLDSPHPNSQFFLTPDTTYRATLIGGEDGVCSSASGERMVNNYTWTFNTGDGTIINDSDGDGVPEGMDQCPDTPSGAIVDASGCSAGQRDSDGDGVTDDLDQCPDTPTGAIVDTDGCSEISVPDVTGLSQAEAEAAITATGLVVGTKSPTLSCNEQHDVVISQNPVEGTLVTEGSLVKLEFSVVINGLPAFTDDFESGNLDNWTIGGRQLAGTNIANIVNCGTGSLCGHLFHDSFTEITMYRNFRFDPNNGRTFYFDLEVNVYSQSPPAPNYYGMAGVQFHFLDSTGNSLGEVLYVAATTNYPFTHGSSTRSVNQISENVMQHYAIEVSDMLSQISIDQTQITDIQMLMNTYSSTYPYPYVSSELWIDNVSTCPPGQRDSDGDGVTDDLDQCPDTPSGAVVDADGCSAGQRDSDGDGVTDDVDQCPDTPSGAVVDADGCAAGQEDSDGDGVTDDVDQCPDTPAGAGVDGIGCSAGQRDSDGDEVMDNKDLCTDTPVDAIVDEYGCELILVEVPDVVGFQQDVADQTIEDVKLTTDFECVSSTTVPAGEVISQDPVGGTMVPIGNTVLLRISSGLPDITTLLEGASAGNFVNPIGPSGMVTTGVGTNNFTWGDSGIGGTGPSSLVFAGDTIYTTPEEEFVIGTLSYFNGTIMLSTEAKTVDLKVDLDFTNPDGISQEFIYQLQLINSRNTGHPDESADMVLLPNIYPGNIITVDGMLYTLKLTFGDVVSNDNGVSKTDRFFVHEGESAVAELRGIITTCNVSKPAPNVVAMPLDEAERVITRAGLKVGDVTTVKSCSVPAGTVISQIPAAGVIVTAGSTLDLIIASAPEIVNDKFPPYGSGDTNTAYDSLPCISEAPSGTLTIGIWFANTSQDTLCSLYFMVNDISGGNLLCNADDGSGSIGSTLIVTLQGDLEDGLLAPGESFYVEFKVGLASMNQFDFWVDLFGVVTE